MVSIQQLAAERQQLAAQRRIAELEKDNAELKDELAGTKSLLDDVELKRDENDRRLTEVENELANWRYEVELDAQQSEAFRAIATHHGFPDHTVLGGSPATVVHLLTGTPLQVSRI